MKYIAGENICQFDCVFNEGYVFFSNDLGEENQKARKNKKRHLCNWWN